MLTCWIVLKIIIKMYSHFLSYLGFCSTENDQFHNGTILHIAYPILPVPYLLMAWRVNSLAPGRFEQNFRWVIFKLISVTDGWGISCKIALRWMPLDLTYGKSTLVHVMAWCRQATSRYLSQCWPRSMSPYGVTGSQWARAETSVVLTK